MKIGIMVNIMGSSAGGQTTYRLATECINRGYEVWIMSAGNFAYDPDDKVRAYARRVTGKKYASAAKYLDALNGKDAQNKWITVDDLDVLLLRSNPPVQSPWAQHAGIHFGRIAMRHGVLVLNDPNGLSKAMNKLYLQTFPEEVWPKTLITRNKTRIGKFAHEQGTIVLKPLQGYGGKNVFIIKPEDSVNLDKIIDSISRDGYVIAQEYLAEAAKGDMRLFLMNGVPFQYKGHYAAFRRVRTGQDMRSNIHAGGKLRRATVDETALRLAEIVRPKLVRDGMFLVGLDIVGNKLMEINVFTPGGFGSAQMFEKVNFTKGVIDDIERKVRYINYYRRNFSNLEMATL